VEHLKDQGILAELKPVVVNHNNSKLYDGLKSCMQKNAELQLALLEAARTIEQLTEALNASNSSKDN
jgi:hypothetical protein